MAVEEEAVTLELIGRLLKGVLDEQRAMRLEFRKMAEAQLDAVRMIGRTNDRLASLGDDLVTTLKAEIGGLFAHLETRLEQRIDEQLEPRK